MKFTCNSIIISLSLASLSYAHVEMQQPAPRKSQFNKGYGGAPDYDMNSPLGVFPCKGYGKGPSVQTVNAGNSIAVKLLGEASHNGGHCQFSLSYDNGKTFVVIKTILGECLRKDGYDYSVQIPSNAPNGDAIFAWSWINRTGNREFYMNCADITVNGSSSNSLSGPQLTIANLPGYPTIPEFTNGGYDGSDLFSKSTTITVNGSGAIEAPKNNTNTQSQNNTPTVNVPSQPIASPSQNNNVSSSPVGTPSSQPNVVSSQNNDTNSATSNPISQTTYSPISTPTGNNSSTTNVKCAHKPVYN